MINMTQYDFSRCRFNPQTEALYDTYPALETAMGEVCSDENVIRYLIMVYDPASPLISAEPSLEKRKAIAIDLSGVSPATETDLKELAEEKYVQAVVTYLFNFTNSRLWQKTVVNEQLYEEYCKRLLQPVRSSNLTTTTDEEGKAVRKGQVVMEKDELQAYTIKAKLREELDTISIALEGYYKQLFAGDEKLIKKNNKRFTPEQMAGM
jgi:hypothetical protein